MRCAKYLRKGRKEKMMRHYCPECKKLVKAEEAEAVHRAVGGFLTNDQVD